MARSRINRAFAAALLAALVAIGSGCTNIRSCIDPTGERFFKHDGAPSCPLSPSSCMTNTSSSPLGCHKDPSESCLHHPPAPVICNPEPGSIGMHQPNGLCISPQRVVAPVGAEVVLKAAVCDQKGQTTANEKVEWMIAPGGVGQFIALGQRNWYDYLFGSTTTSPNKITSTYAVNTTQSNYVCLNRGTPDGGDDVPVIKGQAWVTVTSPIEGTSRVTAYAPNVYGWQERQRTATIYWTDAVWNFPPPASNAAGTRHVFTTCVCRQTTGCPVPNWRVRYEIVGGPPAALTAPGGQLAGYGSAESPFRTVSYAADGAQMIEVPTDSLGQAHVEIYQTTPTAGTNQINVQVIRPGELSSDGMRLNIASAQTQMTWGSGQLFIRKTGPSQASLGSVMQYTIEIRNSAAQTARGVTVSEVLPPGASLVSANPQALPTSGTLTWNFGDLSAGESRRIEVALRADRYGALSNCAIVRSADGMTAQDCVTTTVTAPSIEVAMSVQPEQVMVGSRATFTARVTNRGGETARGLVIVERFDSGLRHDVAPNPIEADLGDLAPGQTREVTSTFTVIAPGQQCTNVEVTGQSGVRSSSRACVTGVPSASGVPPIAPVPVQPPPINSQPQPDTRPKPVLSVRKTGPARKNVGDDANFEIEITNTGTVAANMLKISDNYDLALDPTSATDGHAFAGDDLVWLVDALPPGKTIRFQVNCRCLARTQQACNRVTVTCQEGVRGDSQACLEIAGSNAPLQLSVGDLRDPVLIGNETTYEVRVTNPAAVPDTQIRVSITLPPQMSPIAAGTTGPTQYAINGNTVLFQALSQLAPGASATFRVQARALQVGAAQMTASATSTNTPTAVTGQETTTVFQQ
jgi:uncharacterized repeat protein (TIGR01451 family)